MQNSQREIKLEDFTAIYDRAVIKTNYGDITVKFYAESSPVTVNNFMDLAKKGFYDGTKFHRVIKDFMIQGGDPNSKDDDWTNDGMGGPDYKFQDEINSHKLVRGSLAMANSGPDTNGSQFFIVTADATSWLDGKHTNFGEVIEGMDVIDKIEAVKTNQQNHPLDDVAVEKVELIEK
ncbi:MAG: peptidylprolyl isomerase [bacterium]